jgi:hypothetical protein
MTLRPLIYFVLALILTASAGRRVTNPDSFLPPLKTHPMN